MAGKIYMTVAQAREMDILDNEDFAANVIILSETAMQKHLADLLG